MNINVLIDPLPKPRPRFSGGRCYIPARNKEYAMAIKEAVKAAIERPIETPVNLLIRLFRKYKIDSRRYGDIDNHMKAILDACNGVLWLDDRQVIKAAVEKKKGQPRVEIEIEKVVAE